MCLLTTRIYLKNLEGFDALLKYLRHVATEPSEHQWLGDAVTPFVSVDRLAGFAL